MIFTNLPQLLNIPEYFILFYFILFYFIYYFKKGQCYINMRTTVYVPVLAIQAHFERLMVLKKKKKKQT